MFFELYCSSFKIQKSLEIIIWLTWLLNTFYIFHAINLTYILTNCLSNSKLWIFLGLNITQAIEKGYRHRNNAFVNVFNLDKLELLLAVDTTQMGRTFQDRLVWLWILFFGQELSTKCRNFEMIFWSFRLFFVIFTIPSFSLGLCAKNMRNFQLFWPK